MYQYNKYNKPLTPQNFIRVIVIIHLALLMGQAFFAAAAIFITSNGPVNKKSNGDVFSIIAPVLVGIGIVLGTVLFIKMVAKLPEKETLKEKLACYQTALITRYALSEGASLFCVVCYLVTANYFLLAVMAVNVLYFILIRPDKLKISNDLNISMDEQA